MRAIRPRVLVSAHRSGAGPRIDLENSRSALHQVLELDVDYVEFDVQRLRDGTLVVCHDPWLDDAGERVRLADLTVADVARIAPDLMGYHEVLGALAGRRRAHIDLKASAANAADAIRAATDAVKQLGADGFVLTSGNDRAVRAVREWADLGGHSILVGLSLGRGVRGMPWRAQLRIRLSELLPGRRVRESRANVVVAHHALARLGVASFTRRRGLPLLVWTVDSPRSLRYWLRPGRAWMLTTNHPELALRLRADRMRA